VTPSRLLTLAAVIIFVIAALIVAAATTIGPAALFWVAVGLACLAAANLV
jgi:hypothetical protein